MSLYRGLFTGMFMIGVSVFWYAVLNKYMDIDPTVRNLNTFLVSFRWGNNLFIEFMKNLFMDSISRISLVR
jgi:hypothetical protein